MIEFEHDIFISYAHIDDAALKEGQKGWISSFHRALEIRVSQLLGEKLNVWRDPKLQGNDFFGDEIVDQFAKTAILISVMSPRYIKSEWCTRELLEFYETAEREGGARVGNKSRVFKILKTPVPLEKHPDPVKDVLGYEFYKTDPDTGRAIEFRQDFGNEAEQAYWACLDDLAYDIADLIEQIKEGNQSLNGSAPFPVVYLADTSYELKTVRDNLKRELLEQGCQVLPDKPLPTVAREYTDTVTKMLLESQLAIHIVGGEYGTIPEGTDRSVIVLQNTLAADQSRQNQLERFIWISPSAKPQHENQRRFLDQLTKNTDYQYGAEVFETPLETLKQAIRGKIQALQEHRKTTQGQAVYLAETTSDLYKIRQSLAKKLTAEGYQILPDKPLPALQNDRFEKEVIDHLKLCEISIHLIGAYYGLVPEGTARSIVDDQLFIADQYSRENNMSRWIWMLEGTAPEDERHAAFLETINAREEKLKPVQATAADIETSVLEKLNTLRQEKLKKLEEEARKKQSAAATESPAPPPPPFAPLADQPKRIYLICDQRDAKDITELDDYLYDQGYDTILPLFEGDESVIRQDHEENLRLCDAILIYYGAGDEGWMRSKSRDLMRLPGLHRENALQALGYFIAPPGNPQKARFRTRDGLVIRASEGFSPGLLDEFLQSLNS